MYSGAIVTYPEPMLQEALDQKMKNDFRRPDGTFMNCLEVNKGYIKTDDNALTTYDIAHHVGMSLEQEYEFLKLLARRSATGIYTTSLKER
jgi:hypothetical protein